MTTPLSTRAPMNRAKSGAKDPRPGTPANQDTVELGNAQSIDWQLNPLAVQVNDLVTVAPTAVLGETVVSAATRQTAMRDTAVVLKTYATLAGNRVKVTDPTGVERTFTTPSNSKGETDSRLDYGGKQWLWDSAAHTLNLAHVEPEVAKAELRAVLANQIADPAHKDYGFVPHMNYFYGDGRSVPAWAKPKLEAFLDTPEGRELVPAAKQAEFVETYWSSSVHSDITQPPIIGMAAAEVFEATGDKEFLAEMLPKLSAYYDYLHDRRADDDGLVRIIHPWESGWDNSQRWDEAVGLGQQSAPIERDQIDEKKMRIFCTNKALDWDLDAILKRGEFCVKPVDFNVLYAKNMETLGKLYAKVGDEANAEKYLGRAREASEAIFTKMWDGDKYVDLVGGADGGEKQSQVKSAAMFYPMMLDGEAHGSELMDHLLNPQEFNTENGYSVPTTSLDDPSFDGDNYWRGNIWVIVNFFTRCGVEKYLEGRPADLRARVMSEKIRASTFEALNRGDFYEYFNPRPEATKDHGKGHGVPSFGWNGLAVLMNQKPAFMQ